MHAEVCSPQARQKSTPEAPILIPIDYGQEFIDRGHGRRWLVPLPLQAGSHPEDLPAILSLDVSGLGERAPMDDRRIVPLRTDFEKLDILAS